jgi:hypothetical protein
MIPEENVQFVQCELNFTKSKSSTEIDGSNLILIDFNVAVLAPRLNWIQTGLQLSENIILFAIRGKHTSVMVKMAR